jgi:hypothetical protein
MQVRHDADNRKKLKEIMARTPPYHTMVTLPAKPKYFFVKKKSSLL